MKLKKRITALAVAIMMAVSTMAFSANAVSSGSYNLPHASGTISSWQSGAYYTSGNVTLGRVIDYSYSDYTFTLSLIRGENTSTVRRHMIIQGKISDPVKYPNKDDSIFNGYTSCEVNGGSWSESYMPMADATNMMEVKMTSTTVLYNNAGTTMGGANSSITRVDILRW